jgi:hypothetical protein
MFKLKHTNGFYYTIADPLQCTNSKVYCVPVPGQGLDDLPRLLSRDQLDPAGIIEDAPELPLSFKVGDIVRLKTGTAPIEVTEATAYWVSGTYLKSKTEVYLRDIKDFVFYEETTTQGKDPMALYQFTVDSVTKYGNYLATNSSGMFVMEEKGTGNIHTVDKASVQEVLPHTIGVKFFGSTTEYSYLATPGKFKSGEVYVLHSPHGPSFVTVTGVDTKSKAATKEFKPTQQIQTTPVDND